MLQGNWGVTNLNKMRFPGYEFRPFCLFPKMLMVHSKGVSLSDIGLKDLALSRSDALNAIDLLPKMLTPILGGDVLFMNGASIELAYADWHCDPRDGESRDVFVNRGCDAAKDYIVNFPVKQCTPVFTIVIGD
jgi:hypothetical protein